MKIKYLNLNLWLGGKLFDQAVEFLKSENADVLALQEAYEGSNLSFPGHLRSLRELNQKLSYPYLSFAPSFIDEDRQNAVCGNAILSKFPIKAEEIVFYDHPLGYRKGQQVEDILKTPRNLQHVTLNIQGKILNVFNTQGIWGTDGYDNPNRIKMAEVIIEKVKNKHHVVLSGDLNVDQHTKTIHKIENDLVNIFKGELTSSFNMKQKKDLKFARAVVDFIFVSKDIKVLDHYMTKANISDHMPFIAVFDI